MSTYSWMITRDFVDEGKSLGVMGPRGVALTAEQIKAQGKAFRMLSDDREVYYHGLYVGPDDETLFAPLEDYGTPNSGCTIIEYKNAAGRWEVL